MAQRPQHILVIRLSAMGDVAMVVPVLRALTTRYPTLKISILTRGRFKSFFRDLETVSILEAKVEDDHKGLIGLYHLSRQLKHHDFDAIADLHDVLRSNLLRLSFFGKPFSQINKGRKEKKALIGGHLFEPLKTTVERYAKVFADLGYPVDLSEPKFPKKVNLSPKMMDLIGSNARKWIGIAPFAAHKSKMYPIDQMKKVIEALSKDYNVLLFGGGPKEEAILNEFEKEFDHTINLAGRLSMDEELDLISNLDVMLSMDSGNGHLSAMLGVPTVTIWGVTHPYAGFAPFNQPEEHSLMPDRMHYPDTPTSIYGNKYPPDYENAAGSITPEAVVAKLLSVIS